jgi:hypothetical protein
MNYFDIAVKIAREHAEQTLLDKMQLDALRSEFKKQQPCGCDAYSFPHRAGSGWCPGISSNERSAESERTREEINAEELALFDRAEARAINSGSW